MRYFKLFILVLSQVILADIPAQDYKTSAQAISSGGGNSCEGSYSNFGVLGETFANYSIAGEDYRGSVGFISFLQEDSEIVFVKNTINSKINIYPVPASDNLIIETKEKIEKIVLYDCFGKLVFEDKFVFEIDVSTYSSGIYFLEVQIKEGTFRFKILVE